MQRQRTEKSTGKRVLFWGTLALIALIAVLFWQWVDIGAVADYLYVLDWGDLLLASILLIAGLGVHGARWRYLLGNRVSLGKAFDAANFCHMLNMWLPLRPGEPARIYMIGKTGAVTYSETTGTVLVDRWLDDVMRYCLLALLLVVGLGTGTNYGIAVAGILLVVTVFTLMTLFVIYQEPILRSWPRRLARLPWLTEEGVHRALSGVADGFSGIRSLRQLTRLFAWSLAVWILLGLSYFYVLHAFPFELGPGQMWGIALGAMVLSPPTATTQPGLFHASVVGPLSLLGIEPVILTAFAVVAHLLQNFWITLLGLWGMMRARVPVKLSFSPTPGAD